mmetsp:Transcript_43510/g.100121  ORF Transcript_43510/g.100121 Transcript_43510/m.100121 type:complete len:362 (+) Transcript_43510:118-1203(+)
MQSRMLFARLLCSFVALAAISVDASDEEPGVCVEPGVCTPPPSAFSEVLPVKPRRQWMIDGGFCGAMSIQVAAMTHGAWLSQDLVRKANTHGEGHGNPKQGYEVLPTNIAETAAALKLRFSVWDFLQPSPQDFAFKAWMKSHLVKREPVIWFPICKGDDHLPYPGSSPNGGHFDHIEPVVGIGSQHTLSDTAVYEDDWLVHFSLHDFKPYYRYFNTLEDDLDMDGNCKHAQPGIGKNEMYPCISKSVTYGMAVTGLQIDVPTLRVTLEVDQPEEPVVRIGDAPVDLNASVTIWGLEVGKRYALYRYNSTASLPTAALDIGFEHKTYFLGPAEVWTFKDPNPIRSNGVAYYVAVRLPDMYVC